MNADARIQAQEEMAINLMLQGVKKQFAIRRAMQDATRKANKLIERHESVQNIRRERNDAESRATSLKKIVDELSVTKRRAESR